MRFRAARYVDRIISVTSEAGRSDSKSARIWTNWRPTK